MGDNRRELFSAPPRVLTGHEGRCNLGATCTNSHSSHPLFGSVPTASPWGPTLLHLLCHSPSSLSERTGIWQCLPPCSPSARWLPGRTPTSTSSVLSLHLNPLLLRIELLLYEEGAVHIHEAAWGLAVLGTGRSLGFLQ